MNNSRIAIRTIFLLVIYFFANEASAATYTVSNLNDSGAGSLRQAIADANSTASDDIIEFSVTGTIALTTGELTIGDAAVAGMLTINGPGASLAVPAGAALDTANLAAPEVLRPKSVEYVLRSPSHVSAQARRF